MLPERPAGTASSQAGVQTAACAFAQVATTAGHLTNLTKAVNGKVGKAAHAVQDVCVMQHIGACSVLHVYLGATDKDKIRSSIKIDDLLGYKKDES